MQRTIFINSTHQTSKNNQIIHKKGLKKFWFNEKEKEWEIEKWVNIWPFRMYFLMTTENKLWRDQKSFWKQGFICIGLIRVSKKHQYNKLDLNRFLTGYIKFRFCFVILGKYCSLLRFWFFWILIAVPVLVQFVWTP